MVLIIFINLEMYLKWAFLLYKTNGEEKEQWKESLVIEIEVAQIFKTRLSIFLFLYFFFCQLGPCETSCQKAPLVLSKH